MLALLKRRSYRVILIANFISMIGSGIPAPESSDPAGNRNSLFGGEAKALLK